MIEVLRVERRSLYLHLHVHINRGHPIVVELTIRSLIFHLFLSALPLNAHWKNAHPLYSQQKIGPLAAQNFAKLKKKILIQNIYFWNCNDHMPKK